MTFAGPKTLILRSAVATAAAAFSLQAAATDFRIQDNQIIASKGAYTDSATLAGNGIITRFSGVPIGADGLGIPSFSLTLVPENAVDGTYNFQLGVVIDDEHTEKQLEATLGELLLTVSGSATGTATVSGMVPAQDVPFWGRIAEGGMVVSGEASNTVANSVTVSGGQLIIDADHVLNGLMRDSTWDAILADFRADGHFTYSVFIRQNGGPDTARIGIGSSSGFQQLPCASAADINNTFDNSTFSVGAPAFAVQGQFSTSGATGSPGAAPVPFTDSCGSLPTTPTTPPAPLPPASTPSEIEDALDNIDLSGTVISDEDIAELEYLADATLVVGSSILTAINAGTATDEAVLSALGALSNVLEATSLAGGKTSTAAQAQALSGRGIDTAAILAQILQAFDRSLYGSSRALSGVQQDLVQQAADRVLGSALALLDLNSNAVQKKQFIQSLSLMLSSKINLGQELTAAEKALALAITNEAAAGDADRSAGNMLEYSIALHTRHASVLSTAQAQAALVAAGGNAATADEFIAELERSVDTDVLRFQDASGTPITVTEFVSRVFSEGFGAGSSTSVMVDETGQMVFQVGATRVIPGRALSVHIVPSAYPDGLRTRADGAAVLTANRIATVLAPAAADPAAFFAGLRGLGEIGLGGEDGNITIDDGGLFRFSGTFDYKGVLSGGTAPARASLVQPVGSDESDRDYVFSVNYPDGTQQRIQPFVMADAFVDSARSRGLTVNVNRNTGVVIINNSLLFRPAYFVDPHNAATLSFWNDQADSFGLAYRAIDVNGDGALDYQVISEDGVQVAYGVRL